MTNTFTSLHFHTSKKSLIFSKWLFPISFRNETLIYILGKTDWPENIIIMERKTGVTNNARKMWTWKIQGHKKYKEENWPIRLQSFFLSSILSFGKSKISLKALQWFYINLLMTSIWCRTLIISYDFGFQTDMNLNLSFSAE